MAPSILHLPNGQLITVSSVFSGLYFAENRLNAHQHAQMPPGWTVVLQPDNDAAHPASDQDDDEQQQEAVDRAPRRLHSYRWRRPALHNDALFISSISNPSNNDFKPAVSPTRQIAMMLWATLWWYFHQLQPDARLETAASARTPDAGKPKGEWRIYIKREGIFKGRNLLAKLERMGLICCERSSVGGTGTDDNGRTPMFVSQRAFWQTDPRMFLFTLSQTSQSPYPPASPFGSRPSSPNRDSGIASPRHSDGMFSGLWSPSMPGPFDSSSHLPTFYPPPPAQYTFTNGVRHPLRPRPPRQGETFYTRYVPSVGQYLSFRVASLSDRAVPFTGLVGGGGGGGAGGGSGSTLAALGSPAGTPGTPRTSLLLPSGPSDLELLHTWMNDPRVSAFWGVEGPIAKQEEFLRAGLSSRHSFPVIGCWDGRPFGYFELYWAKEDAIGRYSGGGSGGGGGWLGDWDRGVHVLVGEQQYRGEARVRIWLSALLHYLWLADQRTMCVLAEPRVDNEKFIGYLREAGFYREREVALPHKQAALMKVLREAWTSPAL